MPATTTIDVDRFGWVGATIDGKYRIDALVAEGGCGIVYIGHHLGFDQKVAIKCLKLDSLPAGRREVFLESFLAEGRIMSRLSQESSAIVRPIDLGSAVSPAGTWTPFLVLEWVPGKSLEVDLDDREASGLGGRSIAEAIDLLEPVAHALEIAHEQGIAHRDFKPGNMMLTLVRGKPSTKLLDFGVAKTMSNARVAAGAATTAIGPRIFTTAFGAPEQFDPSHGATGPWTDVFAFALVFVNLVAGRRPMNGDDGDRLWAQAVDKERRPTLRGIGANCSDALERVLMRALAVDPRNRHRTLGELWTDLVSATTGASTTPGASRPDRATGTEPAFSATGLPPTHPDPTLAATRGPTPPVAPTVHHSSRQAPTDMHVSPGGPPKEPTHIPPGPSRSSREPGGGGFPPAAMGIIAALLLVVVLLVVYVLGRSSPASEAPAVASAAPVVSAQPEAEGPNDGSDVRRPVLAPSDVGFIDVRAGWGWGDRCWKNIQAEKWGWAKAECDEAMKLSPASPNPRASLLYNEGLIAAHAGDVDEARRLYTESLKLRDHRDVRDALARLTSPLNDCSADAEPDPPRVTAGAPPTFRFRCEALTKSMNAKVRAAFPALVAPGTLGGDDAPRCDAVHASARIVSVLCSTTTMGAHPYHHTTTKNWEIKGGVVRELRLSDVFAEGSAFEARVLALQAAAIKRAGKQSPEPSLVPWTLSPRGIGFHYDPPSAVIDTLVYIPVSFDEVRPLLRPGGPASML